MGMMEGLEERISPLFFFFPSFFLTFFGKEKKEEKKRIGAGTARMVLVVGVVHSPLN